MANYYWVGGSGTWDTVTTTNWSSASGGAGGAGIPGSNDFAIIDANSGTGTITTAARRVEGDRRRIGRGQPHYQRHRAHDYRLVHRALGSLLVHWEGSDSDSDVVADDMVDYAAITAQCGGGFVIIPSVETPNPALVSNPTPTANALRCADRTAQLLALYGAAHVFDALPTLQGLGTGSTDDNNDIASGRVPRSCLYDSTNGQVHLSQAAMDAVAAALVASGKLPA